MKFITNLDLYLSQSTQDILDLIGKTDSIIFGGFLRDYLVFSYTENEDAPFLPHSDIDVIALPDSEKYIKEHLESLGFKENYIRNSSGVSTNSAYKKGDLTIDLVDFNIKKNGSSPEVMWARAWEIVSEVDIRCCGLAWTKETGIVEVIKGAEKDCIAKIIYPIKDSPNYSEHRYNKRKDKLIKAGWSLLRESTGNKSIGSLSSKGVPPGTILTDRKQYPL